MPNPILGVAFHWLGGLAAGSFYAPYRGVRGWSWETYWLVGGVFSWIVAPWAFALVLVPGVGDVLGAASTGELFWPFLFGALWGVGGLTFGLSVRYLGMSLGIAVALGYCTAFGTLVPPIFDGTFMTEVLGTASGRTVLFGIFVCCLGIAVAGMAGVSKDREAPDEQKRATLEEFDFKKGFAVATISGIMSSCFAYGLAAGEPIKERTVAAGSDPMWQGLPVLIVILLGGFLTNFVWCVTLNVRNRSGGQYFSRGPLRFASEPSITEAPEINDTAHPTPDRTPLLTNWLLCAAAGVIWYLQFFFYSIGESQMGAYGFSSWTMHMASIIIFSTLWGIALKEWSGASRRTRTLLAAALGLLVLSTLIVGCGGYLFGGAATH